jgi:hypothetical protein
MYVPQEQGLYWDTRGDLWSRDSDGWRWLGRRIPWTGNVVPADPGHGPLSDRVLGMLVDSPDDAVLPLRRVAIEDYPPDS